MSKHEAKRRSRRFIPNLALLGMASSFSMASAIFVIGLSGTSSWRIVGLYALDPELGFYHRPGARDDWTDLHGNREQASINSIGLRGREIAPRKSRPRVLLIGDSMVYGHGVTDGETLPAQLQELLERSPTPMEVINGGIKGYGIDQEFKLLGRLMSLQPDYVAWFLYENDFSELNGVELTLFDLDPAGDRLLERDIRESFYYRSTQQYLALKDRLPTPVNRWLVLPLWRGTNKVAKWIGDRGLRRRSVLAAKLRLFTRALAEASSKGGFRVLLAVLPSQDRHVDKDLSFLKQHSALPILDLDHDPRLDQGREKLFLTGDSHLSAAGGRRVAEIVRDWIAAQSR
ncbi:MAG TPA: SGNH/GDSL hydrolase family protein [Bdellovibrionota bacterium]|nr:SGNH/GDSL hydrolase family protein [Bdellovibrionota bacterium]